MTTEINKQSIHPEGKIALIDGRILEGYAIENTASDSIDNDFKLDTTGQYLSLDGKKPQPKKRNYEDTDLFYENAHLLLDNAEKILSDSRLFLAPVNVGNNLAYIGTAGFNRATLGVYVEWWLNSEYAVYEENGQKFVTCCIAGSPLSGMNRCSVIDAQGNYVSKSFPKFRELWGLFVEINRRYDSVKDKYQAYTLKEAIRILSEQ